MPPITRRDLLASGLAASTSSLVGRTRFAHAAASLASDAAGPIVASVPAASPRELLPFDFGWKFLFGHGTDPAKDLNYSYGQAMFAHAGDFQVAKAGYDDSKWRTLDLPHDWAVELPFVMDDSGTGDNPIRGHGYKPLGRRYPETSVGWYRREFQIAATDAGRRIWIEFDGVFRDSLVWVNGCFLGRSDDGYTPFRFELTDYLHYGGPNCIVLRVDASQGDGWFYEGAGIYRHVSLLKTDPIYLGRWDSTIRSVVNGRRAELTLNTTVFNQTEKEASIRVNWKILDASGAAVARASSVMQRVAAYDSSIHSSKAQIANPSLWSIESPILYTAVISVDSDGGVRDSERISFGVRTVVFDPNRGLLLNGRQVKIQGAANHQDHAGVGSAVPDALYRYRLQLLREMGCNAVRTSHNMPAPAWVEACDRTGVMLYCETRHMGSSPEYLGQLAMLVKRYRNSPSVIIWGISNEERILQNPNQLAEQGERVAASMVRLAHKLDPTRVVSGAVDGDNEHGLAKALDIAGFNYNQKFVDPFHTRFPARPVFASEQASTVATRGEYRTDKTRNIINGQDAMYGLPGDWWKFWSTREWTAGGFMWSGFDYRGEPSPYRWPSVSSQFGSLDTCGFPKDYYYYYRAWWRDEPMLHLFPHWNWEGREGDEIPLWVYSNLDEIELLVNGKSLGRQKMPHLGHLVWKAHYEPGVIEARGMKDGKVALTERHETTGPTAALRITSDRTELSADGQDVAVLKAEALDSSGRWVPTAGEVVRFTVTGPGRIIGVGNGDPNSHESDKESRRSLYNGLVQAIVQSTQTAGEIHVTASAGQRSGQFTANVVIVSRSV